jgi:hypothetical protein
VSFNHSAMLVASDEYTKGNSLAVASLGVVGEMLGNRSCSMDSCQRAAVSRLAEQNLCINHFVLRCYEQLERADPWVRKGLLETWDRDAMKKFVDECSQQVLDISMRCPELSNLEKGRLLDILLWAGDLLAMFHGPQLAFTETNDLRNHTPQSRAVANNKP